MAKRGAKQGKVEATRNTLQPKLIAVAVSMALAAPASHAEWTSTVDLFVKPGNKRSYGGVDALVPLSQDGKSLFFADLKANIGSRSTNEFNLGGGYRFLSNDEKRAYGLYGAWDRRRSERNNYFNQLTLGAEVRGEKLDLRANYYHPLTDKEFLGGLGGTSHFSQHNVYRNGIYEEAMGGFDVEVGALLPVSETIETRAYLAGYSFKGEDVAPRASGVRARVQARLNEAYTIGASVRNDDEFGTASFLEVRYSLGKSTAKKGIRSVTERMAEPWTRDLDVIISDPTESSASGDAFLVEEYEGRVVNIDSSNPLGGTGDGSAEDPYTSVYNCETVSGAKCSAETYGLADYTLVRLWQGDSTTVGPYTGLHLVDGQTLWGEGIDIFNGEIFEERYPVISDGVGVLLATDSTVGNTVAGVEITRSGTGIQGNNSFGTVNIHHNIIETGGGSTGIHLANYVDNKAAVQTVYITDNQIYDSGSDGVVVENKVVYDGTLGQTVTVSDNSITAYGGSGVALINEVYYDGVITQNATISDNGIDAAAYSMGGGPFGAYEAGVSLFNLAGEGGGTVGQTAVVSGNTIATGTGHGISSINIANDNDGGGAASVHQTITVSENTITMYDAGSYGSPFGPIGTSGVSLINIAGAVGYFGPPGRGTVSQTALVSGNTINDENHGGVGVSTLNWAKYPGSLAAQDLTVAENTVNDTNYGMSLNNLSKYLGTATQNLTVTGNTVSSRDDGVFLTNKAGKYGTSTQTLTMTGNTVTANNDDALYMLTGAYDDSSANLIATVSGNTLTSNDNDGVDLENFAENESSSNVSLTLSDNTITAADDGVFVGNYVRDDNYNNSSAILDLTVSGNTIVAGSEGVDLESGTYGYSSSVITTSVTGNTITVDEDGVDLDIGTYGYSSSVITTTVSGNTIVAGEDGVDLDSDTEDYSSNVMTATVSGNTVTSGQNAVEITDDVDDDSMSGFLASVLDNTLTASEDGVNWDQFDQYADDSSTANHTLNVSGNTITADGDGVYVQNKAGDNSDSIQQISVTNNTIVAGDDGVEVNNKTSYYDDDQFARQTVTINDNTITAQDDGVRLRNEAFGMPGMYGNGGVSVQNAFVNGNTITADSQGSDGIYIQNDDDPDNKADQTVVTSNNQIGGFYNGVYVLNYADEYESRQDVVVTGTTVTSTVGGDADYAVAKCNYGSYQNVSVSSTTLDGTPVAGATDVCVP